MLVEENTGTTCSQMRDANHTAGLHPFPTNGLDLQGKTLQ